MTTFPPVPTEAEFFDDIDRELGELPVLRGLIPEGYRRRKVNYRDELDYERRDQHRTSRFPHNIRPGSAASIARATLRAPSRPRSRL